MQMEEKAKIKLIFYNIFTNEKLIYSYKFSFEKEQIKPHIIKNLVEAVHVIPDEVFKFGKDKAIIYLKLFDNLGNVVQNIRYQIYYGYNNIYLGKENLGGGYNIEFDFKNAKILDVHFNKQKFNSYDDLNTKDRKKITLLNYNNISINVKETTLNIKNLIENCPVKSDFYRISMNLEEKEPKIIIQPVEELKEPNLHLLNEKKDIIDKFYNELCKLIKADINYKVNYNIIINKYYSQMPSINYELNRSSDYLEQYFHDNPIDFNIVFEYEIFRLFRDFIQEDKENNEENESEENEEINKNDENKNELLINIFNRMNAFYESIKKENLKIFDKISLLVKISNLYLNCENMRDFNEINIFYIILSDCEKNSILDKTKTMFDDFILKLTENSKIFEYLLNINAGIGYYNKDKVYTFDMTTLYMLKNHLKEIFPKILVFYDYDDDNLGNTDKYTGCIGINLHKFSPITEDFENVEFDKKLKDEEFSNDMALNIFIILLHEFGGHKKFLYNKNSDNISPKKIINELNKLIEFRRCSKYKKNDNKNEYLLSSDCSEDEKGESGCYLELSIGKYEQDLITTLLVFLNNKSQLFNRADLFTGTNFDIIRKYTTLRCIAEKKNIKVDKIKNLKIENQIAELEESIKNSELKSGNDESKKEKKFINKKRERKSEKNIDDNVDNKEDFNIDYDKIKRKDEKNMKINKYLNKNKIYKLEPEKEKKVKNENKNELEKLKKKTYTSNKERFKILKKYFAEKYKFKDISDMIKGINKIIEDKSVSGQELYDLCFVLRKLMTVN